VHVDDMVLVSIHDHSIEPPDLFERHMPAKYRDDAPKLVKDADGRDQWVFQGGTIGVAGLAAVVR
jgi:hypothetical protein